MALTLLLVSALLAGAYAISDNEIAQFNSGDGRNKTVNIVDNGDGTVSFSVYPECSRKRSCNESTTLTVNKSPVVQAAPAKCVRKGLIGFGLQGQPIVSPGRKSKKSKGRRRGRRGTGSVHQVEVDALLGVALDGYPIYSANSSEVPDRLLNSSDLDQCGGRCDSAGNYRYHFVHDRPVVLGCVRGDVLANSTSSDSSSSSSSDTCSFYISCDATSIGSCTSGQDVPSADFTCIEPPRPRKPSPPKPRGRSKSSRGSSSKRGRGR